MSNTVSLNELLNGTSVPVEARARALQAAYIGEAVGSAFAAVKETVAGLYGRWRDRVERARSIDYLSRLDDRLLADIGLSRVHLAEVLDAPAHRPSAGHVVPPVESVIAETAPARTAANQDQAAQPKAA